MKKECNTEHLRDYPDCYSECAKEKCDGYVWKKNRYCFHCHKVKTFYVCDNCGKFFCPECSGQWEEPELGDYGSIISQAYLAHTKC